jgi:hypothetical protein
MARRKGTGLESARHPQGRSAVDPERPSAFSAFCLGMISSESRFTLFRIMPWLSCVPVLRR